MTAPIDSLLSDHSSIRKQLDSLNNAFMSDAKTLDTQLLQFQKDIQSHFQKEDTCLYSLLDRKKRESDRELLHDLRNDRAAVIFSLASLLIKRKKGIPLADCRTKWTALSSVLLHHFEQEEKQLFKLLEMLLTPEEKKSLEKALTP